MGSSFINQQSSQGETMVELDSTSSSQEEDFSSPEDEEEEEINSSVSFHDMSSLLQHLPFKRGLSRHYQGKSQSFTSLLSVKSVEDLAKPENPYKKKLKSCRSYGVGLLLASEDDNDPSNCNRTYTPPSVLKASSLSSSSSPSSRASCSPMVSVNKRPPIPHPHRSTSTSSFSNGSTTALIV